MNSWIVFGGEDQRQALMANRQQKRQPPRNTTNIVVRNGSSSNQAGPSRAQQARRRRNRRKPQQTVVRVLSNKNQGRRRVLRAQGFGNRMVVQKIVTTLGTVGSNGTGSIETELAVLLNPSTMKETTGSNTYGPVQIYASTYSLFSIRSLELQLKPLVGGSAVSGTVVRASWNPTSNPTQMSWSALGARKHADVTPGREGKFVLTAKDLKGPKDGWYRTNTKGEPMLSFAGSLEIHTYGETRSTYQNQKFTGGLFLAELKVVWAFKDYAQQPGLMNLLKGDSTGNTTVSTDNEGRLILETPTTSALARASRSTTTASEIIWLVTDAVVTAATHVFPPPFSWLLRGGWWFLKKIGGAPSRSGNERFMIYASINDARASVPCVSTTANANPVSIGQLHFQQITPGNTGVGPDIPSLRSIEYPGGSPTAEPTQCYVTSSTMIKLGTEQAIPSACVWYNKNGGQNHAQGVGFKYGNTKVATFNIHKVVPTTNNGPIDPTLFDNTIPFYLFANQEWETGRAVASSYHKVQESNESLWISNVLFYVDTARKHTYDSSWNTTTVTYPTGANTYTATISTTSASNSRLTIKLEQGGWYVAQFVVQGIITGQYSVGDNVIASIGQAAVATGSHSFTPAAGSAGSLPTYMSGPQMAPFTTTTITSDAPTSRDLSYEPSFGCDDCCEFPPPPSGEDLDSGEDEFEDPEEDDDEELELGPDEHYSDPPLSRLVVRPEAQFLYENLAAQFSDRVARLAVNQLHPSDEYSNFTALYHDALADGLSPREARAHALGL
nr:ORF2 [Porcine astrovirus 2]